MQAYQYNHNFQFSDKMIFLKQFDFNLNWKVQINNVRLTRIADLILPVFSRNIQRLLGAICKGLLPAG
jgi:hypothetical protein